MDPIDQNVNSYEQRSTFTFDGLSGNRVIIANRRDPKASWSTPNQPISTSSILRDLKRWLYQCFKWLTCFYCKCLTSDRHEKSSRSLSRFKWSQSILAGSNEQLATANFDSGPFVSNEIRTSKYTLLNFLPKNLFEQFRRLANFYFLTTAIFQIIIPFSPVGPSTNLLPLLFVVSTTAIKQAYEDYLRHKLDRDVNNRLCSVLIDKRLHRVRSKDIRVGDIVLVRNNEEIPCDMVLLSSSCGGIAPNSRCAYPNNQGVDVTGDRCYITTANLDGETSLKSRTCFAISQQIGGIKEIDNSLLVIECERPNATLFEFNGFLRATRTPKSYDKLISELNTELNSSITATNSSGRRRLLPHPPQDQNYNAPLQEMAASSLAYDDVSDPGKRSSLILSIYKKIRRTRKDAQVIKQGQIAAQQLRHLGQNLTTAARNIQLSTIADLEDNIEIPLDISNLLPRASRLRNTKFVYGIVVYTGIDTRLAHNSQLKPNKFSSLESRVNAYLIIAFLMLIFFTLVSSMRHKILKASIAVEYSDYLKSSVNNTDSSGPLGRMHEYTFVELIMAHFVLYNYLVPISLYVTLEFMKFLGTMAVVEDKKLQVPLVRLTAIRESNTQIQCSLKATSKINSAPSKKDKIEMIGAQCNSSDLNEDLGQVEVLFSDKTGTLTENKMRFIACSIGTSLYRSYSNKLYEQPAGLCFLPVLPVSKTLAQLSSNRYAAIGLQLQVSHKFPKVEQSNSDSKGGKLQFGNGLSPNPSTISSEQLNKMPPDQRPFDHRITPELNQMKLMTSLEQNPRVTEFFICLCLCSTINLNEQLPINKCLPNQVGNYDLQSASPDEESLISAAAKFGVIICKASDRESYIAIQRSKPNPKYLSPKSPTINSSKSTKKSQSMNKRPSPSGNPNSPVSPSRDNNGVFKPVVETEISTDSYIVRKFERLVTFEFNSTRKKMSVLYRDCDNNCLILITKGSENVLDCIDMSQLNPEKELCIDSTLAHFEAFSKSGLRTMLVARKQMTTKEYEKIVEDQRLARLMSPADRDQQLAIISKQAESNMQLIGSTAVEDSLQDGVPETIADLKSAGIKVWLLTGDKVETAISVAYLCKLLERGMTLLHLVRQQDSKSCRELLLSHKHLLETVLEIVDKKNGSTSTKSGKFWEPRQNQAVGNTEAGPNNVSSRFALVADGRSLHYAMKYSKKELAFVCKQCACVLGCRLSPLQKAEVVEMIKKSEEKPICAAIGDGANDVSMIQEAHVGIGIRGNEGRQAVNSSDFALNRFHMLNRLFFVHGHLFYHRTANTIHYFFYKNMLFVLPQFLYSFYTLGSVTSLYHPIMLLTYNLIFTSAPILLFGLCEVNIPKNLLEDYPKLYTINRRNKQMRYIVSFTWLALGALQATIAFCFLNYTYGEDRRKWFSESNKEVSKIGFATVLFFAIVYAATMRLFFLSRNPGFLFYLVSFLSCILLPVLFYVLSLFDMSKFFPDNSLHHRFLPVVKTFDFWLSVLNTLMVTIVPDALLCIFNRTQHKRKLKELTGVRNG